MKISLRRRHALMVEEGAFSHQNCITGSRVTAFLLNGWIFPIAQSGEASRWRVCYQRGLPRLVLLHVGILNLLYNNRGGQYSVK